EQWEIGVSGEKPRCLKGWTFATRRRLVELPDRPGCLRGPLVQNYVYTVRDYCGGEGVEAIGQARAIKFLSDRLETPSRGLISPNVQWEVSLGRVRRPDIFVYDRFPG